MDIMDTDVQMQDIVLPEALAFQEDPANAENTLKTIRAILLSKGMFDFLVEIIHEFYNTYKLSRYILPMTKFFTGLVLDKFL